MVTVAIYITITAWLFFATRTLGLQYAWLVAVGAE